MPLIENDHSVLSRCHKVTTTSAHGQSAATRGRNTELKNTQIQKINICTKTNTILAGKRNEKVRNAKCQKNHISAIKIIFCYCPMEWKKE